MPTGLVVGGDLGLTVMTLGVVLTVAEADADAAAAGDDDEYGMFIFVSLVSNSTLPTTRKE